MEGDRMEGGGREGGREGGSLICICQMERCIINYTS